jgi:hypothetical protein
MTSHSTSNLHEYIPTNEQLEKEYPYRFGIISRAVQVHIFQQQYSLPPFNNSHIISQVHPSSQNQTQGPPTHQQFLQSHQYTYIPHPTQLTATSASSQSPITKMDEILFSLRSTLLTQNATDFCHNLRSLTKLHRIQLTTKEESALNDQVRDSITASLIDFEKTLRTKAEAAGVPPQAFNFNDFLSEPDIGPMNFTLQMCLQATDLPTEHAKQLLSGHVVPRLDRNQRHVLDVITFGTSQSIKVQPSLNQNLASHLIDLVNVAVYKDSRVKIAAKAEAEKKALLASPATPVASNVTNSSDSMNDATK